MRTISVSYLRSILEHARCYVLDRDVELVYYTVRKSSDVLTRDTLQLGAQIISWLRPVAGKTTHRGHDPRVRRWIQACFFPQGGSGGGGVGTLREVKSGVDVVRTRRLYCVRAFINIDIISCLYYRHRIDEKTLTVPTW